MEVCANCGHQLGVGRFCTNCGMRVDQQPETSGPPTPPPPAVEPPPQARYPLFADDPPTRVPPPADEPPPVPPASPRTTTRTPRPPRRSTSAWLPWAVGGVALLLFAMIGALLLLGDDDPDTASDTGDRGDSTSTEPTTPPTSEKPPKLPDPSDDASTVDGPIDLARYAIVDVPDTAPPNVDVSGNQVRYEAENMLDGVPATCWRMPGSAADRQIVFSFREPVQLTEVGMINGYAKTSGDLDWYNGNRRVLDVEWVFDDGTSVEQALDSTRDLQTLPIEPVTTTSVTLRLLDVSEPGRGRAARNYTAISDVSLIGEPA